MLNGAYYTKRTSSKLQTQSSNLQYNTQLNIVNFPYVPAGGVVNVTMYVEEGEGVKTFN